MFKHTNSPYLQANLCCVLFTLYSILNIQYSFGQPSEYKMTEREYIEKYKEEAITEMLMHKIPASITLAQGMLESNNGNSALAVYANNHFGIKCHKEWSGMCYIHDDDEPNECFRKYPLALDSYNDHSAFLKSRPWYAPLFELRTNDYKGWAYGLKKSGYATDPRYTERLLMIIEKHKLFQYDYISPLPSLSVKLKHTVEIEIVSSIQNRTPFNGLKYTIAQNGDSYYKIATDAGIELRDFYKYNDIENGEHPYQGQILYLQSKKNQCKQAYHIVKEGESLKSLSQLYGIKLSALRKKNKLKEGEELKAGIRLLLNDKRKEV